MSILFIKAQVGINIQSPQGIFHIDPKKDTSGGTNVLDDFIITPEGRVGIGTISPTTSLDIVGNLRIADGTQYDRYVMTSDANGVGAWKKQTYTSRVVGNVPATLASIKSGNQSFSSTWTYTGANITLPAGTWMIYFYCAYNNDNSLDYTIWWDLLPTTTWSAGIGVGRVLSYTTPANSLSTTYASYSVVVTAPTTYYVIGAVGGASVPAGKTFTYNSGARIWAIPIF